MTRPRKLHQYGCFARTGRVWSAARCLLIAAMTVCLGGTLFSQHGEPNPYAEYVSREKARMEDLSGAGVDFFVVHFSVHRLFWPTAVFLEAEQRAVEAYQEIVDEAGLRAFESLERSRPGFSRLRRNRHSFRNGPSRSFAILRKPGALAFPEEEAGNTGGC